MQFFKYGKRETEYLARNDNKMAALIRQHGMPERPVIPDLFEGLVTSIIAQQISSKAAATVTERLRVLCKKITPDTIARFTPAQIQTCGMTLKKATYIATAAGKILTGRPDLRALHTLDDESVVAELTSLPGIGRWTAEMLLLHSLQRPDIFSYDDLVIRRSLMSIHNLDSLSRTEFADFRKRYSPYCSVAMIYLWKHGSAK